MGRIIKRITTTEFIEPDDEDLDLDDGEDLEEEDEAVQEKRPSRSHRE